MTESMEKHGPIPDKGGKSERVPSSTQNTGQNNSNSNQSGTGAGFEKNYSGNKK